MELHGYDISLKKMEDKMAHNKENPSIKAPQGIEERKKCMEVDQSDDETKDDPEETKGEDEVTMAQNEAFQD